MDGGAPNSQVEWIAFGPFLLFPSQRLVKRDGKPLHTSDKILDLLIALLESPGEFLTKAELVERVWQREWVEDINIRVAVSTLRKLLGKTAEDGDYIVSAVGRGYAFSAVVPVERWPRSAGEAPSPKASAEDFAAAQLPVLLNPVIGREHEIDQVIRLLDERRLVTIVGPGGIGKTTVAISSASRRAETYGGACFVDFAPIREPTLAPTRIAGALGLKGSSGDPLSRTIDYLSQKQLLLVLDNCEHVADAVAEIAERVLRQAPHVAIIATSREPLRTEGEVTYKLESLTYPPMAEEIDAQYALGFSAVQLFVERIQAAHPGFVLTDALAGAASEICRRLDGIALAIQLAAGRVPALGVTGVASHLDDRFRLLSQGQRTALPRHRTLEGAFDWSFDLLSVEEQTVLKRISAFSSAFTLDAALQIAGWPPIDEAAVATIVANLVDKSLVVFTGEEETGHFRLLATVRAFAQARLLAGQEAHEMGGRHAQYVLTECRKFRPGDPGSGDRSVGAVARTALDDLRSALRWAFETSNWALALDLVFSAIPLFSHLGLTHELKAWIMRALDTETKPLDRLSLLIGLGGASHLTECDPAAVTRLYSDAFQLAQELGDVPAALQALWGLMVSAHMARKPRLSLVAARKFQEIAVANDRAVDALIGECLMAVCFHSFGELAKAERHLLNLLDRYLPAMRAVDLERYLFDHRMVALRFLASIEWLTGRIENASKSAAAAVAQAGDHLPSLFLSLSHCACPVAIDRGDWAAAAQYTNELYRRCGHNPAWRQWADALNRILAIRVNQSVAAVDELSAILETSDEYPTPGKHVWYRLQLIKGYMQIRQPERARLLLNNLIHEVREREELWLLPEMLRLRGVIEIDSDPISAETYFSEAHRLAKEQGALTVQFNLLADYFDARQLSFGESDRVAEELLARLPEHRELWSVVSARQPLWQNAHQPRPAPKLPRHVMRALPAGVRAP